MLNNEMRQTLIQRAVEIRRNAYAPYSHYAVGAAVLAASGEIYTGVNVENAAYPTSMCAERTAIFSAVTKGEKAFDAIAVVTENGGAPCGACRQVLSEFGLDLVVLIADMQGRLCSENMLSELLPRAFTPGDLQG